MNEGSASGGRTPSTTPAKVRPPLARDVVRAVAVEHGVCVRPVALRRTDLTTGETDIVNVACGHTLASVCPSCAENKRRLRAAQCRQGWHLDTEPAITRADPTEQQRWWVEKRAEVQARIDTAQTSGEDASDLVDVLDEIDAELQRTGVAGKIPDKKPTRPKRSTRRRQDVPDLPRRPISPRTIGKTYTGNNGTTFRPSIFLTLTLDTYGRVHTDGTPLDPSTYDYVRAARDALHFPKLLDRFIQNLRRFLGQDVQYFAAIEPQRRLAPHIHMAIRGTISRTELRQVAAATYHHVWWPPTDTVAYTATNPPLWDPQTGDDGTYVDPTTGRPLTTWDEALAELDDPDAQPLHICRLGSQVDAQGVLSDSPDARRCIGYLTKYLTKDIAECHTPDTPAQTDHVERLAETLRHEPCSPTCANWLRYGIQPKNPKPGLTPGYCKHKAHRREHLGHGGRRVLVSRKWSGKTLADHRADRKNWVLARLAQAGLSATDTTHPDDPHRYIWEKAPPGHPHIPPLEHRILTGIAEQLNRRQQLDHAATLLTPDTRKAA